MTFIQPNKQSNLFNIFLGGLIICALGTAVLLIMVYNGTVSFAHAAEKALDEEKALEAENSELKRAVFSYFDPVRMAEFAEGRGMVTDKKPQYVSLANSSE